MIRTELEDGKIQWQPEEGESWASIFEAIAKEKYEKILDEHPDLQKFSHWETIEATKKHSTLYNYNDMIERALECGMDLSTKIVRKKINSENMPLLNTTKWDVYGKKCIIGEFINIFDKFDLDTLKRLHNNGMVYKITKYIIHKRNKFGDNYLCIDNTCKSRTLYERFEHNNANLRIQRDNYRYVSNKEDDKMILWATKYIMDIVHFPEKFENDPQMKEIREYIIKYLQFATTDDLVKLMKLTSKGFKNNKVGRPTNDVPIYVLDKYGEKVVRYKNRKECMEKEGIGQQYLQQLLKGDKMRKKCRYCEISDDDFNHLMESSKNW